MNFKIHGGFVFVWGMLIVSAFLAIAYAGLLLLYRHGWRALPEWHSNNWVPSERVSVVVPARNEAANIKACLQSIAEGSYPTHLLEIIVVDDHSDDDTASIVQQFSAQHPLLSVSLLPLVRFVSPETVIFSWKKKALEIGIAHASGEVIVTTDADCEVPKDWLRLLASGLGANHKGVVAPVSFHREHNLLQHFQSLDLLGLMGIAGAGIFYGWQRMGNGANFAYRKAAFEEVGGFDGNEHLASGDDMFLLQKIAARWPGGVFFLKNPSATVFTEAKPDWRSFFQQRLRWGTKNVVLKEWPVRLALLVVFLFCWSIWLNLALSVLIFEPVLAWVLLFQTSVKALSDFVFLREMCFFFKRMDLLRWFVPSFFLHTLYIPIVGTASLFFKKYEWKGRRVR
ncbi:MAG: glycosyltransferase [Saprospiraceae bacterium]|nr:glycosyltransferase [Saprospiraceae bacterium]